MSLRRTLALALGLALALTLGAASTPPTTEPAPGNSHNNVTAQVECEEFGGLCLYDGSGYTGTYYFINMPTRTANFCVNLTGTGFNDRANSMTINGINNSSYRSSVRLYWDANCPSATLLNPPGRIYSVNLNGTMADNITSSVRITVEEWV